MLHIIGLLLKFIGILLLVILGIVVILLCTVLFVPIKYEVKADYPDDIEKLDVKATITWILRLIRVEVSYLEKKIDWHVRAAWFHLGSDVEKKTKKENKPEVKKEPVKKEPAKKEPAKKEPVKNETPKTDVVKEEKTKPEKKVQEKTPDIPKEEKSEPKEGIIKRITKKIHSLCEQIKCTFKKICDKIKEGLEIKDKVMDFLQDKVHKDAFMRVKKELIWIKRLIRVKKGNLELRFGFEDPSLTGKILAGLSVLYPYLGDNMCITPEFETVCLEGKVYLKGHIRLIHIVMFAIKLIIDKNVRKTFKDIMELKDELI